MRILDTFLYLYILIVKQLTMDKDKKISRLEQKLNKAQEEIKSLKSELRSVKSERRKESKKKDVKSVTLTKVGTSNWTAYY